MSNYLDNGTVLPSGLLGGNSMNSTLSAFNHSYKNTALKAGIVIRSYPVGDPNNINNLCTEYDVLVVDQSAEQGSVSCVYKNCPSSQGLGSIADFFETALRPTKTKTNKGSLTFRDQDGAIVLLLCLNGFSEKGIIIGGLNHPDRETTITDQGPKLSGEYNGVNILVNEDGSCSLTFKGATNSKGIPIDATQGNTEFKVETDGSFQFDHATVTIRGDKNGTTTVTTKQDCIINCTNSTVNASGKATVNSGGDTDVVAGGDCNVTSTGQTVLTAEEIHLNGQKGNILTTVTDPLVDLIYGTPTVGVPTVKSG